MLTKKQKQVLDFIKQYGEKHDYSPSIPEMAKHFKRAVGTMHEHVERLGKGGYLQKQANKRRGIEVSVTDLVKVPLLGTIAAGEPIEAISEREFISVPRTNLPRNAQVYALKVNGNSMIDENINDGDVILVRRQETAENGQKVVALINTSEVTLKKFYKEKGHIRLQPANKTMQPLIFSTKEVSIQGILFDVVREDVSYSAQLPGIKSGVKKYKKMPLNEIIYGDAVDVMQKLPSDCIDLVVTSPPYDELRNYNGYAFNFEAIARGLFRVMKNGGVFVWVVGDKINKGNRSLTSFKQALFFQSLGFNVHDVMIYRKKNTPFMRSNAYTNCYEFMFVFTKCSPKTFNPLKTKTVRQGEEMLPFNKKSDGINKKIKAELKPEKTLTNIWEYAVGLHGSTSDKIAFQHTAIFPERLAEDHILSWTKSGDIVFDPMCGSGTTCKMAKKNGRLYIGCDISKEYVDLAKKRLSMI